MKKVKRVNEHQLQVELEELQKNILPLLVEMKNLLIEVDVNSIAEFELKVNEQTKFVNAMMSATALGLDDQYKRLLELEQRIDSKLSLNDITASNKLKSTFIDKLKAKHTIYYSNEEIEVKKQLEKAIETYNAIPIKHRKLVTINRQGEMVRNPFIRF